MNLRISDDAQEDLLLLRDYLKPRSPHGYQRILIAIFAAFDQLEMFPLPGREGEVEGTCEVTVRERRTGAATAFQTHSTSMWSVSCTARLRYPFEDEQ